MTEFQSAANINVGGGNVALNPSGCRALTVGTAGDIAGLDRNGNAITFRAEAGVLIPIRLTRIDQSGTAAANITVFY